PRPDCATRDTDRLTRCVSRLHEPTARSSGLDFFRTILMSVTEATLARLPRSSKDGDWTCSVALSGTSAGGEDASTIVAGQGLSGHRDTPLFIAQMAACVRLCTLILRRIALTWTFTVASMISILRAITLLVSPSTMQRRMDFSLADSRGVSSVRVPCDASPCTL